MKILSIDTSSNICGISILENNNILCNLDTNLGRTHSENLMPLISSAFEKTGLMLKNIDLLVCDIGPGSFTGIRIGVATAKAFADSLNIPCVGISSLECLCCKVQNLHLKNCKFVCSMIDCKNDACYFSFYELFDNSYSCIIEPKRDSVENILQDLKKFDNIVFVGDGALTYKDFIVSRYPKGIFLDVNNNFLDSYSLGIAGLQHYLHFGENSILPLYL